MEEILKSKKEISPPHPLLRTLIFVFCFLGLIFIILLAKRIIDPMWNPFRPKPEAVLNQVFFNLQKLKSLETESEISAVLLPKENLKINIKQRQRQDFTKGETPISETDFEIYFETKDPLLEGKHFLAGKVKRVGKEIFVSFENFPEIEGINFEELKGKWIKIEPDFLTKLVKEIGIQLPSSAPQTENLSTFSQQIPGKEQLKYLRIVKVKKQLKDEKIEKKPFYHYSLEVEKENISQVFSLLGNFSSPFPLISFLYLPLPSISPSFLEAMKNFEGEIWVDKKEILPKKVTWQTKINIEKIGGFGGTLEVKIQKNYLSFNKEFEIQLPQEYQQLVEFLKEKKILEKIKKDYTEKMRISRDETRKNYISQIYQELQNYFRIFQRYPVSDGYPLTNTQIPIGLNLNDPGLGPCENFVWISNRKNPWRFCIFACLENGKFFAASPEGLKELEKRPKDLNCR